MTSLTSLQSFLEKHTWAGTTYTVQALHDGTSAYELLKLSVPKDEHEQEGLRYVPSVTLPACAYRDRQDTSASRDAARAAQAATQATWAEQKVMLSCLIRAGVRHPGLHNEDLRALHRDAWQERHVELFADLNALTTGLLSQVAEALDRRLQRIVLASTTIDVLHEYLALPQKSPINRLTRAEMERALRSLNELRERTPVHVHQLPPGATRYFVRRNGSGGPAMENGEEREEPLTYISEDRQMIAAYWDYLATSNPRVPVRLVTSDLALSRVCKAERVPFLFARTPHEEWRQSAAGGVEFKLTTLYLDPFSLHFRYCTAHSIVWELSQIFRSIRVIPADTSQHGPGYSLRYDPSRDLPRDPPTLELSLIAPPSQPGTPGPAAGSRSGNAPTEAQIRVTLQSILAALPTRPGQRIPISKFSSNDTERLRQFRQIGEVTQLYALEADYVVPGAEFPNFSNLLKMGDYIGVNGIFRRFPAYDRALGEASAGALFPRSERGGAVTNWAIHLGAAYKTKDGARFGLAPISDERFEEQIVRAHDTLGRGDAAVPLPRILDKICTELQISPIRFEAQLAACLGQGALRRYEAQRALANEPIPDHSVLVAPTSASPDSYLRKITPGKGVVIGGQLVGSLVRRGEGN